MPPGPPGSSEQSSLLENGASGGDSLNQPFMATYNGDDGSNARGEASTPATATATAATVEELEVLESAIRRQKAIAAQTEVPETPDKPLTKKEVMIRCIATVCAYLLLGVIAYTWLAGMDFVDALYFCVVTLTTVGYGDLSAHTPATKLFACFYILIGVAMVAAFLGKLVEFVLDEQEDLLMDILKRNRASAMGVDSGPPPAEKVELASSIGSFLLLVVAGTVVFMVSGHMSLIDAFYLTVVSSSTVGYGDYYPTSAGTRIFATFFLPLSTLLLGKVVADYTEMKASERTKARETRILLATVTAKEYTAMDTDGDNRISPLEFMCSTLIRQEKVTQEDITEIHNRFTALDRDLNGFITRDEIGKDRDLDGDGFIEPDEL